MDDLLPAGRGDRQAAVGAQRSPGPPGHRLRRRADPIYYDHGYGLARILGAVLVLTSLDLVSLAVDVMNALLLPIVLGFLLALEAKALPPQWQMRGWHKRTTWFLCLLVIAFGLYMIPKTLGITL